MAWYDFLKIDPNKDFGLDNLSTTAKVLGTGLGAYGLASALGKADSVNKFLGFGGGDQQPVGYQGGIPKYTAVRAPVSLPAPDAQRFTPARRPGSGGLRYFTDMQYVSPDQAPTAAAAASNAAQGLAALNAANTAATTVPDEAILKAFNTITGSPVWTPKQQASQLQALMSQYGVSPLRLSQATGAPVARTSELAMGRPALAGGGLASLARSDNYASGGYYLGGPTDGMADKIPARIGGTQEARLSDGEFVMPADVVSHLGNGNSDAGAQVLYNMMNRVRKARTGTTRQGRKINPNNYTPA